MRALVIGLGSMGKRRIRNLKNLGVSDLVGVDQRFDRRQEVENIYRIHTFDSVEEAIQTFQPDFLVISTSPESHMKFALIARDKGIDAFIEASVTDLETIQQLAETADTSKNLLIPSSSMRYFPGPALIRKIVAEGRVGRPIHFTYTTGQKLEDWHPWEPIADYYVSKRETGGAREIVPFELTWLCEIFGLPKVVSSTVMKLSELEAQIDDYYNFVLSFPSGLVGNITIDVISSPLATREFRLHCTEGTVHFSGDRNLVQVFNVDSTKSIDHVLDSGTKQDEYINPEEPYIQEMRAFLDAILSRDVSMFPNNLANDAQMLRLLAGIEQVNKC